VVNQTRPILPSPLRPTPADARRSRVNDAVHAGGDVHIRRYTRIKIALRLRR